MSSTAERVQGSGTQRVPGVQEKEERGAGSGECGVTAGVLPRPHVQPAGEVLSTQYSVPRSTDRPPRTAPAAPLLGAKGLVKSYRKGKLVVPVLKGVDFQAASGEFVAIVGQSGCGKSTLLHLLGTLDAPDSGTISLDGKRIDNLPAAERDLLRNRTFGYIFQFYHLLPELNTLDNVLMPAYIGHTTLGWWKSRSKLRAKAEELLRRVGLSHRMKHRPRELSGGEMQRAAVARALLMNPRVLLADEPTGNLDAETGNEIVRLLRDINRDEGVTIVMVTHNLEIVSATDRVVRMVNGVVTEDSSCLKPFQAHPRLMAV
jgi:lipoprotein-releasing system ATP-binding protein